MDKKPALEQRDAEYPSPNSWENSQRSHPSDPNSWFRNRLDYIRKEARKYLQQKFPRPHHEK